MIVDGKKSGDTNIPDIRIRSGAVQIVIFFMLLWLIGCAESTAAWIGRLVRVFWLHATGVM